MSSPEELDAVAVVEALANALGYTLKLIKSGDEPVKRLDPLEDLRAELEALTTEQLVERHQQYQAEYYRLEKVREEWGTTFEQRCKRLGLYELTGYTAKKPPFPLLLDVAAADTRRAESLRILSERIAEEALGIVTAEPSPAEPPTAA
jgi:hypothetical protein